ncbi:MULTISPECIES: peroxiredoxin-like family protein [Thiorhodovibrio]|uniref:peroxiredoxin-like family protein n=1 Tax=Thiorhodovibrio TaxID=61593 RepID=UPI00191343D6|nr:MULTISPECIES: peroxiredoxin-like family protein [Thiorhodovibrio]WPL14898.1 Putative peroxiredoxin [Thiorhodovibrio litoralis]
MSRLFPTEMTAISHLSEDYPPSDGVWPARRHPRFALAFAITMGAATLGGATAAEPPPLPSYQADLQAFQAEQAKHPPPFTAAEREQMEEAAAALAAAMPEPGLRVGETAPDFRLPNARGKMVQLSERLAAGPVILTFYRGVWCPYCNLQLRGLHQSLAHFARYQAQLIAVTPQQPDRSLAQVKQDGYPFEILSNLEDTTMRAYRLAFSVPESLRAIYQRGLGLDLADYNGNGRFVLPVPATFVIDRDGVVRYAFAETDYRQRAEPPDILAALADLSAQEALSR